MQRGRISQPPKPYSRIPCKTSSFTTSAMPEMIEMFAIMEKLENNDRKLSSVLMNMLHLATFREGNHKPRCPRYHLLTRFPFVCSNLKYPRYVKVRTLLADRSRYPGVLYADLVFRPKRLCLPYLQLPRGRHPSLPGSSQVSLMAQNCRARNLFHPFLGDHNLRMRGARTFEG